MVSRQWMSVTVIFLVACFLLPLEVPAQERGKHGEWWTPIASRAPERAADEHAVRGKRGGGKAKDRVHRRRERRSGRGLHIPRGHLPPPGQCRLWYPGQPPGQQPPPTSCRVAYRRQRGPAVVVTHRGVVRHRPPRRWQSRPAGDIVFRRPPPREEGVHVSVEIIIDILGRAGYQRLEAQRRRMDVRGTLTGRWVSMDRSGGHVLQVRAGGRPLAEFVDRTGDGHVETMYVRGDR